MVLAQARHPILKVPEVCYQEEGEPTWIRRKEWRRWVRSTRAVEVAYPKWKKPDPDTTTGTVGCVGHLPGHDAECRIPFLEIPFQGRCLLVVGLAPMDVGEDGPEVLLHRVAHIWQTQPVLAVATLSDMPGKLYPVLRVPYALRGLESGLISLPEDQLAQLSDQEVLRHVVSEVGIFTRRFYPQWESWWDAREEEAKEATSAGAIRTLGAIPEA